MKLIPFFALGLAMAGVSAAQDNAPAALAGKSAVVVISSGSGPFAPIGGYRISFSPATYTLSPLAPTVAPTAGTYTYAKTGANTGRLTVVDAILGSAIAQNLVFSSVSTATYAISGGGGSSTGTLVFEGSTISTAPATGDRLINLSVRTVVPANSEVTPGFVLDEPSRVLIRVAGPALAAFGVSGTLANPKFSVRAVGSSGLIATNDDWSSNSGNQAAVQAAQGITGAFAFPVGSRDAAVVLDLPPGGYTAAITGDAGTSGEVIMEVYLIP